MGNKISGVVKDKILAKYFYVDGATINISDSHDKAFAYRIVAENLKLREDLPELANLFKSVGVGAALNVAQVGKVEILLPSIRKIRSLPTYVHLNGFFVCFDLAGEGGEATKEAVQLSRNKQVVADHAHRIKQLLLQEDRDTDQADLSMAARAVKDVLRNLKLEISSVRVEIRAPIPNQGSSEAEPASFVFGGEIESIQLEDLRQGSKGSRSFSIKNCSLFCNPPSKTQSTKRGSKDLHLIKPVSLELSIRTDAVGKGKEHLSIDARISNLHITLSSKQFKLLLYASSSVLRSMNALETKVQQPQIENAETGIWDDDRARYTRYYRRILQHKEQYQITMANPVPLEIETSEKQWVLAQVYNSDSIWTMTDILNVHASVVVLVRKELEMQKKTVISKKPSIFSKMWSSVKSKSENFFGKEDKNIRAFQSDLLAAVDDKELDQLRQESLEMNSSMQVNLHMSDIWVCLSETRKSPLLKLNLGSGARFFFHTDGGRVRFAARVGIISCLDQRVKVFGENGPTEKDQLDDGLVIVDTQVQAAFSDDTVFMSQWNQFDGDLEQSASAKATEDPGFESSFVIKFEKNEGPHPTTSISGRAHALNVIVDIDLIRALDQAFSVPVSRDAKDQALRVKNSLKKSGKDLDLGDRLKFTKLDFKLASPSFEVPTKVMTSERDKSPSLKFCPGSLIISSTFDNPVMHLSFGAARTANQALLSIKDGVQETVIVKHLVVESEVSIEDHRDVISISMLDDFDLVVSPTVLLNLQLVFEAITSAEGQGTFSNAKEDTKRSSRGRGGVDNVFSKPLLIGSLPSAIPVFPAGTSVDLGGLFHPKSYVALILPEKKIPGFQLIFAEDRKAESVQHMMILPLDEFSKQKTNVTYGQIIAVHQTGRKEAYTFSFYTEPDEAVVRSMNRNLNRTLHVSISLTKVFFKVESNKSQELCSFAVNGNKASTLEVTIGENQRVQAILDSVRFSIPTDKSLSPTSDELLCASIKGISVQINAPKARHFVKHSDNILKKLPEPVLTLEGFAKCDIELSVDIPDQFENALTQMFSFDEDDELQRLEDAERRLAPIDSTPEEDQKERAKRETRVAQLRLLQQKQADKREKALASMSGARVNMCAHVAATIKKCFESESLSSFIDTQVEFVNGFQLDYSDRSPPIFRMPRMSAALKSSTSFSTCLETGHEDYDWAPLIVEHSSVNIRVSGKGSDALVSGKEKFVISFFLGENDIAVLIAIVDAVVNRLDPLRSLLNNEKTRTETERAPPKSDSLKPMEGEKSSETKGAEMYVELTSFFVVSLNSTESRSLDGKMGDEIGVKNVFDLEASDLRFLQKIERYQWREKSGKQITKKFEFSTLAAVMRFDDCLFRAYIEGAMEQKTKHEVIRSDSGAQMTEVETLSASISKAGVDLLKDGVPGSGEPEKKGFVQRFGAILDIERSDLQSRNGDKLQRLFSQEFQFATDTMIVCDIDCSDISLYEKVINRTLETKTIALKTQERLKDVAVKKTSVESAQVPINSPFRSMYVKKVHIRGISLNVFAGNDTPTVSTKCDSIFLAGDLFMKRKPKEINFGVHLSGIKVDIFGRSKYLSVAYTPLLEEWSFSIFVQKFRDDYIECGSDFSKGFRISLVSPGMLNINLEPGLITALVNLQNFIHNSRHDENIEPRLAISSETGCDNEDDLTLDFSSDNFLGDLEEDFQRAKKKVGESHMLPLYGEERTGKEDLSSRENILLSLKGNTLDRLAGVIDDVASAVKEDATNVGNTGTGVRSWMSKQGNRFLPTLSVSSQSVVVFVFNFINIPITAQVDIIQESSESPSQLSFEKVLKPSGLCEEDGNAYELAKHISDEKIMLVTRINGVQIDLSKDDEVFGDLESESHYRFSVVKKTVVEDGLSVDHLTITLYSVLWVINNTNGAILVRENEDGNTSATIEVPPCLIARTDLSFINNEEQVQSFPLHMKPMTHSLYRPKAQAGNLTKIPGSQFLDASSTQKALSVQIRSSEERLPSTGVFEIPIVETWSKPISIDAVGTEGQIEIVKNSASDDAGIVIKEQWGILLGANDLSKFISLSPRYMVVNQSSYEMKIRQARCSKESTTSELWWEKDVLEANTVRALHFCEWKGHVKHALQISVHGKSYWSDSLYIDAVRPLGMQFRLFSNDSSAPYFTIEFKMKHEGATTFIIFSDTNTSFLCVDLKLSWLTLKMRQFNILDEIAENERGKKLAAIEVQKKSSRSCWFGGSSADEIPDEYGGATVEDDYEEGVCPPDQMKWEIIRPKKGSENNRKHQIFLDYDHGSNNAFEIRSEDDDFIGTINVVKTGKYEFRYNGKVLLICLRAEGAHRIIELTGGDRDDSVVKGGSESQELCLSVDLAAVGISLSKQVGSDKIEEILLVNFKELCFKYSTTSAKSKTYVASCSAVQVDNQSGVGNAVILSPAVETFKISGELSTSEFSDLLRQVVRFFMVRADMWKLKRSAKEQSADDSSFDKIFIRILCHEIALFVKYEEPLPSLSAVLKDEWIKFRDLLVEPYGDSMKPFEDIVVAECDRYNATQSDFFFAVEKHDARASFNHIELDLPLLDIEFHEEFIFDLLTSIKQMIGPLLRHHGSSSGENEVSVRTDSFRSPLNVLRDHMLLLETCLEKATRNGSSKDTIFFFQNIDFHPINIRFTYAGTAVGSRKKLSNFDASSGALNAMSSMMSIEDLVLIFASLSQRDASYGLADFKQTVGKFYRDQALRRMYKVVLNVSVLDSPVKAVAGIGSGVSELLNSPGRALGALRDGNLNEAKDAVVSGVCFLGKSVVGGAAKVGSGLLGGVGYMVKSVTGVSAVTRTVFGPATKLLDWGSDNLDSAYKTLVDNAQKSGRRDTRVRLPRICGARFCYLDACAVYMLQNAAYSGTGEKHLRVGSRVPAIGIVQSAPRYICSAFVLRQRILLRNLGAGVDFTDKEPVHVHDGHFIMVLTSWHLSCVQFEHDNIKPGFAQMVWAIPLRRMIDLNISPICGKETSSLELSIFYSTEDSPEGLTQEDLRRSIYGGDEGTGEFIRNRKIVAMNRRNLYNLFLNLRQLVYEVRGGGH